MKTISLIPGDGIGPEISKATREVLLAAGAQVEFEEVRAGAQVFQEEGAYIPDSVFQSLEKNKIALKGPITTPIGHGFRSLNVELRKRYDLFANIRPIKAPGRIPSKFENVDMVLFRENTEDLYAGIEEKISEDEFHSIKVITREKSLRIIEAAFDYAQRLDRKKVTVVTKANIMKLTDGLFLSCAREVAKDYPQIPLEEVLVDNMAMQMVLAPEKFDVIVTENLYGDILSDLGAALVGGIGLVAGVNKGKDMAIYEAVHGSAPDIAGKNMANPTAMILTACLLLEDIGQGHIGKKIRLAIEKTLENPENFTRDLGGTATTTEFTQALIRSLS